VPFFGAFLFETTVNKNSSTPLTQENGGGEAAPSQNENISLGSQFFLSLRSLSKISMLTPFFRAIVNGFSVNAIPEKS
jgi:hypothetical protein